MKAKSSTVEKIEAHIDALKERLVQIKKADAATLKQARIDALIAAASAAGWLLITPEEITAAIQKITPTVAHDKTVYLNKHVQKVEASHD